MSTKAAYIHIPFCSHICYYCDFNKVFIEGQPVDEYIELLIREMELTKQKYNIQPLETLYVGGGTPSSLNPQQMERLLDGIHQHLPLQKGAEFTMELNPDDGTPELLSVMKEGGVNRLSMGVQTFNNDLLKAIGRKHTKETAIRTIENARHVGFENMSIDLIFRLPKQTIADFEESLKMAMALDLPHYSIYSLILEQKTVFYNLMRQGKLPLPSQDEEADMFELAMKTMEDFGRHHYEISNYALPGYESRHNLHYWKADEYFAFGAGAHGYVNGVRYQNNGPIQHYLTPLRDEKLPIFSETLLTKKQLIEEFMFLGLRKFSGVSKKEFMERFGNSMDEIYGEVIQELIEEELLTTTSDGYVLTHQGKFLGNNVFQSFLIDENKNEIF